MGWLRGRGGIAFGLGTRIGSRRSSTTGIAGGGREYVCGVLYLPLASGVPYCAAPGGEPAEFARESLGSYGRECSGGVSGRLNGVYSCPVEFIRGEAWVVLGNDGPEGADVPIGDAYCEGGG